ncbi:MAG TPA: Rieske (2Fe-2S) protein [Acidothermaceae bacterium]|jgi:Rieske Fe-S protein|nr:Rieske (2Fe-2S) protein [Acidothermaceae bacterium]
MDPVTPAGTAADSPTVVSRRTVLVAGIAVAGTAGLALAGCSTKSAAVAPTGNSGVLAKVADIPVGNAVSATLDGKPILISQPVAGEILAFTAICTHQGCTVAPAGKEFKCPCHGSVYNAATGAVITGPAPAPLAAIPVKVEAGSVVAG